MQTEALQEKRIRICDELFEVFNIFKNDLENFHFDHFKSLVLESALSHGSSSEDFLSHLEFAMNTVVRTENQSLIVDFFRDVFSTQNIKEATQKLHHWTNRK